MDSIINKFDIDFKESIERLKNEFSSIHTGRATPALLDGIFISVYGQNSPIKNVASINIEDMKSLKVVPWDKSQVKEIEKAILVSNLGLSVSSDEGGVRVVVPQLTSENREKLVKVLKQRLETARIAVRQIRERGVKEIEQAEKDKDISEDQRKALKDKLQKKVDATNESLEGLFELKEKEVLGN